jgi:cytochrome oxidase Cu insertion factor (SCO1/SenC/PrrC family)
MREKLIDIASIYQKKELLLLSFTIDLKNDSISDLNKYSETTNVPKDKWYFLKGSPSELSKIAKKFKTSFKNTNNYGDFYPSSFVALVDTKKQVREF